MTKALRLTCLLLLLLSLISADKTQQYSYQINQSRVQLASLHSEDIADAFRKQGISYPPEDLFIRIHKLEGETELWARDHQDKAFKLVKTFSVCNMSGALGPKRQQGDYQVPEGIYHISKFNPHSSYHLSLQVNYPNRADRILTSNPAAPGNLIFVHGACASAGCVAIENRQIEWLYWACLETKKESDKQIPVHILPFKMDHLRADILFHLEADETKAELWSQLKAVDDQFRKTGNPAKVEIDSGGAYNIKSEELL